MVPQNRSQWSCKAGHPWGRRCLVFMALVNSLHLGDHWEVGTGRFETRRKNREYPTGEIRNLQRWSFTWMGDSLEVTVCGRYSISCLGLYTFIYKGKRGEEMNELQVTRISIHDVVIAPKTFEFVFWLVGVLCFVFWFLDYCSWLLAWLSRFWPSNTSTCWEV